MLAALSWNVLHYKPFFALDMRVYLRNVLAMSQTLVLMLPRSSREARSASLASEIHISVELALLPFSVVSMHNRQRAADSSPGRHDPCACSCQQPSRERKLGIHCIAYLFP